MVVLGTTIHELLPLIEYRPSKLVDGPPTNVGLRRRTKSDHDEGLREPIYWSCRHRPRARSL
jgi:hypothetical protein